MPQQHTNEPLLAKQRVAIVVGAPVNAATIALLEQWADADATRDAAAIARAEQELSEFKASLNANRPEDRPIFP